MNTKNKHMKKFSLVMKTIFIAALVLGAYIFGYTTGNDTGKSTTTQEFLEKQVNLPGAYFDQADNIQLNTFSCTPNNSDGDCSRQVIQNYGSISQHWLDYCRRISNSVFNYNIEQAKILRDNLNSAIVNAPTAICNDGTYSYSANRSGTCSSHGGVRSWY